jgi:hypothetical protein
MSTTVIDLLDSLRTHLSSCDLPAPCAVNLTTYPGGPSVSMQIACLGRHPYRDHLGADLMPHAATTISLATLRHLATDEEGAR